MEQRLIDANALLEAMKHSGRPAYMLVQEAPTIEARPVVQGRWIHDINNLYACSECMERETMSPKKLKKFCPNCGAKMDLEE